MKLSFSLFTLLIPALAIGQLSESLLHKVRNATEDYYIVQETLPITGSKTLPCLEVKVNGHGPYSFLIDLGSNVLVFKQSVVEDSGMEVLIDRDRGDIVKAAKLEIGGSVFIDVHGASYKDLDVDGVIGFNMLRRADFTLDYPNMELSFIEGPPENAGSSYVKYETFGRMPYLKSMVGEKEAYINFDTGAELWLYFPYFWKDSVTFEQPLREFREMSNTQTGTVQTYIGKIKEDIDFGNYKIKSPYVVFDPDIEDIYVGSSLLSEFQISFYPEKEWLLMERKKEGNQIVIPENQKEIENGD